MFTTPTRRGVGRRGKPWQRAKVTRDRGGTRRRGRTTAKRGGERPPNARNASRSGLASAAKRHVAVRDTPGSTRVESSFANTGPGGQASRCSNRRVATQGAGRVASARSTGHRPKPVGQTIQAFRIGAAASDRNSVASEAGSGLADFDRDRNLNPAPNHKSPLFFSRYETLVSLVTRLVTHSRAYGTDG